MNTAEVVQQCRDLPGVTVQKGEQWLDLLLESSEGNGRMRFRPMFPGVTLAHISVNTPSWPAPLLEDGAPEAKGPLIINYCTRGRCELVLNDSKSVFLTAGHISLTERFARGEYVYPGRVYEGIELFIDPETAQNGQPMLREVFGVDIAQLCRTYCPDGETFISRLSLPEQLNERLSAGAEPTALKTAVIDLLALLQAQTAPEPEQLTYYTRAQVEMARQVEAAICADLTRAHTARNFAQRFGVSESSIKNYFFGVFGQSIAQYAARQRMQRAAELLEGSARSIIEVANEVGYQNQSKFSAAFRRAYGLSPREYRHSKMIAQSTGEG